MSIRLNWEAFEHARELIHRGFVEPDDQESWSAHQPSIVQENELIEKAGWAEYGRWHLGIDDAARPYSKGRYRFRYGDFNEVHRCGVLDAEIRAGRHRLQIILDAAAHLLGMIDKLDPSRN